MFLIWAVTFLFVSAAESQTTCTDISLFAKLEHGKYLAESEFKSFPKTTLLVCVKQCQLRSRCLSFNFEPSSGNCVLNDRSSNDVPVNFTNTPNSAFSDVTGWLNMSEECTPNACPENTVCMENGMGDYECLIEFCLDPPKVDNAQVLSSRFLEVGSVVPYVCSPPYVSAGEKTCLPNGSWSGEVLCIKVQNCKQVKKCNSSYSDGEYWVNVKKGTKYSLLKVYCNEMDTSPRTFLTLHGNNTFSVFPNKTSADKCGSWLFERHCGKTVFSKVKLSTSDLTLGMFAYKFASTECKFSPLGFVGDCRDCDMESVQGSFQIDTTGTGVKVSERIFWKSHEGNNTLDAVMNSSQNGLVISGECRGGCDYCRPAVLDGRIPCVLDPMFELDFSQATLPLCSLPN